MYVCVHAWVSVCHERPHYQSTNKHFVHRRHAFRKCDRKLAVGSIQSSRARQDTHLIFFLEHTAQLRVISQHQDNLFLGQEVPLVLSAPRFIQCRDMENQQEGQSQQQQQQQPTRNGHGVGHRADQEAGE